MRVSLALVLCAAFACGGRDDLDGRRRPLRGLPDGGVPFALPLGDRAVAFDLYDNRAAALAHAGGALVIECGGAELAVHIEGGYRSPWRLGVDDGGTRAALIPGLGGELYLPIDGDPGGVRRAPDGSLPIELRARAAVPHQLVSVFLNEQRLGEVALPTTAWATYRISAPAAAVRAGENRLRFFFRHRGQIAGVASAAAFARIAVGGGPDAAAAPALRAAEATHGGARLAALQTAGAGRISYYTAVPERSPELVFAQAGAGAHLAVQVAGAAGTATLWTGRAGPAWADARVDLAAYAGQVVRIDLLADGAADWGRPQLTAAPPPPPPPAPPPVDHVIVWTVASLRADRLIGPGTPTFAELAAQAVRFTGLWAAAPSPGLAHAAMLTGTRPAGGALPPEAITLGERFREAGFATALISGNGFVSDEAGFAQGFDLYLNPMRRRRPHGARVLWQAARRLLAERGQGEHVFVYIATVEPHLPYTPSREALAAEWQVGPMRFAPAETAALAEAVLAGRERLTADERAFIEALYRAELRDADAAFAEMLADLRELGIADRTAVILVGDHGEELWERGGFGHGRTLYEEALAVPLVVRAPGGAPRTVAAGAEQIDIYSTALDLAGIAVNPEAQGESLVALARGADPPLPRPALAYLPGVGRALKLGRYKMIVPATGPVELYDLAADPGERTNRMGSLPLVERYLRNLFGLAVAYEPAWRLRRWGTAASVTPAFAADHGL